MPPEQESFLDTLVDQLHRDSVEFAVVFGSVATGETHPLSDLDLAIKFDANRTSQEQFQELCFLSGTLQQPELPFVDVSDITELSLSVAHDAVNGVLLCGDEAAFEQFKTQIETEFSEHQSELQHQNVIARIAEEGLYG